MPNPNDSVLRAYFPDDADKVLGEEPFFDTNEHLLPVEYNGDLKYTNLPPQELRRRIEAEEDEAELRLLKIGLRFWEMKGCNQAPDCGEPYRGEKAPDRVVKKLADLVSENGRVTHVKSQGGLNVKP